MLKAVSSNSSIPILAGIYIQAHENEIVLTTSNTSMTIQCRVPQDKKSLIVRRTGGIVVSARYFNEVIRKLSVGIVTLEIKEHLILTIKSGNSQIRLSGMDPDEFPLKTNKKYHAASKLRIKNRLLKSTINQVVNAASKSEVRPILTGVCFDYDNNSLHLTATDGVRLASRTMHTGIQNTSKNRILIPATNLYEVSKMLKNDDETIDIDVVGNQVRFKVNELIQVESALIEGTFPSVTNVIPQTYLSEIELDTTHLLHAVECVSVLAGENIIRLLASRNALELSSRTADIGDVQDEVPLIQMSGEDFSISINGKYFIDILHNIDSERVKLWFTGKVSPVVIIPDDAASSTLFLITPVRTHN